MPIVSVVMSVYNAAINLSESISSILEQRYDNFEFIIINDGSIDDSLRIIHSYMRLDDRIVLISRENYGLPFSLNEGIKKSRGKYIARMDADDVSLPDRLGSQLAFMESTDVDICGGHVAAMSGSRRKRIMKYPLTDEEIKYTLIGKTAFAHPSVMIKREIFESVRYEDYKTAQDYRLWCDMATKGFKMANLDKVLLHYRIHSGQVTVTNRLKQKKYTLHISRFYVANSQYRDMSSILSYYNGEDVKTLSQYCKIFKEVVDVGTISNVEHHHIVELCRSIFRGVTPMSLIVGIAYFCATKNLHKDVKGELYVFIQACLHLSFDSSLYGWILTKIRLIK